MERFLLKLACYCLIVAVITGLVNAAYIHYLAPENKNDNKFLSVPNEIEICNFGNSHSEHAFNYEKESEQYNCFNFALSSQSLSYDLRLLQYYRDKLKPDGIAFFGLSFSSVFGFDETMSTDFESKNQRYYSFLPEEYIKAYDAQTAFYLEKFPAFCGNYTLLSSILQLWQKNTISEKTPEVQDKVFAEEAEAVYNRHLTSVTDAAGKIVINESEIDALYEMIAICRDIGVTPILFTPPYSKEYIDLFYERRPDLLQAFRGVVDEICKEASIPYYDYSEDARFSKMRSLFYDPDHLNSDGGMLFTEIVMDEVVAPLLAQP